MGQNGGLINFDSWPWKIRIWHHPSTFLRGIQFIPQCQVAPRGQLPLVHGTPSHSWLMEVYSPKVIIGFDPQPDWNLTLGFQPVHSQAFSLSLSVFLKRGLWFPFWFNYQRKLGRNTSGLRTNRIVRLDIDGGWCTTWHHLTIYHKRIDIDEGWCATWHHLTICY